MTKTRGRSVQYRHDGTEAVGSFGARRISDEVRDWIASEAKRTNRTQRALMEDVLESFIKHRKGLEERYHYEVAPLNAGRPFRMYIRLDLLEEITAVIEEDGIFNGDLVLAAIKYEQGKDGQFITSGRGE